MDNSFLVSLLSGAAAGTGVDLILFPLDTFKTRIQSKEGFWRSGGFRGVYSGLPSTLLGSAPTAALFFTIYDTVKVKLEAKTNRVATQIVAANLGEISACLIRVPVDVVKQRSQAQLHLTTLSVFKDILRVDGLKGFYRSYLTTVLREIPFATIQFPLWEYLKVLVVKYSSKRKCEPYQSAICGAFAGGVAAGLTTPLDVVKTRITLDNKKSDKIIVKHKILNTFADVIKQNGIKGLFAGIYPRVTMISFGGFIFFGIYEETRKIILHFF